jgi:hypothetical protein
MKDKAYAIIKRIGEWYLLEYDTYIRIYVVTKAPHPLPKFVPEILLL